MATREEKPKFGEMKPVSNRRVDGAVIVKLFVVSFCLAVCGVLAVVALRKGIENRPPTIEISPPIGAVGVASTLIHIRAADNGSGLKHIALYARRGAQREPIFQKEFTREKQFEGQVEVSAQSLKLSDGSAELLMEAEDDSLWSNKTTVSSSIVIDQVPPVVEVIYASPEVQSGQTGLVLYRATDDNLMTHGVKTGERFFAGATASSLHSSLGAKGVYATFFSTGGGNAGSVVATDVAGNAGTITLDTVVRPAPNARKVSLAIGNPKVMEAFVELLRHEADPERAVAGLSNKALLESLSKGVDRGYQVLASLADIRATKVSNELAAIVRQRPESLRQWQNGPRLALMRMSVGFNDEIVVANSLQDVFRGKSDGVVFESSNALLDVSAALEGVVKYTGDLGVLGKTVAMDHGFGVTSAYFHLEKIDVDIGSRVELGRKIGSMGASGFALGPQLGVMVFVQGYAVDPRQWLEASDFQQSIQLSMNQARSKLGTTHN